VQAGLEAQLALPRPRGRRGEEAERERGASGRQSAPYLRRSRRRSMRSRTCCRSSGDIAFHRSRFRW